MSNLLRDVRYSLRLLLKSPGFSVVVLLTLAIGIGATTAMFSVVNGVLLRPLPFKDPDRLMLIKERLPQLLPAPITIPASDVATFARETTSFDGVAGFIEEEFDLTGSGAPQKAPAARVGWNLFAVLGVQPALGRGFTAEEDHPDSDVAVVSYRFWQQQLGGARNVLQQTVTLDRKPYQIVGVMPRGFTFPLRSDKPAEIWVPMGFTPAELKVGGSSFAFGALARLRPGVTMGQARGDVEQVTKHIAENFPSSRRGDLQIFGVLVPLKEDAVGDVRKPLLVLLLAVACVLLIAVVNVANLLLARGTARQRELAIRVALGAGARRIFGQLLVESIVLGLIGGLLGLLLAFAATRTLLARVPSHIPRLQTAGIDGPVLLFVLATSVLAAIGFGAVPALFAWRTNLSDNLKEGGRSGGAGRHHQRVRAVFVIAEVALALMLLAGAGLLLRSFQRVLQVDPGFQPENVVTARVSLPPSQYSTPAQLNAFFTQLESKLEQLPGVKAAALSTDLPLETLHEGALTVNGYTPPPGGAGLIAYTFVVGDHFHAMGIPLLRGRLFTAADDENGAKAVIISQELARKYFAGRDPIGGQLKLGTSGGSSPWWTVVGVVGDVKPFGLDGDMLPHTYMPYVQHLPYQLKGGTAQGMVLVVRTAGDPAAAAASVRNAVWAMDREVPVSDVRTMEQVIAESNAPRRFTMALVGFFALAALLLAGVGLYGVMSYAVSQRAREIGVRMVLGARRADVLRMVLGAGLTLVLVGVAVGLAGAFATLRLLASFLFGVRASDPVTFLGVVLVLAAIALAASMVPALRATRVDPVIALRNE